jgi:hypothetical protein
MYHSGDSLIVCFTKFDDLVFRVDTLIEVTDRVTPLILDVTKLRVPPASIDYVVPPSSIKKRQVLQLSRSWA